ncbi:hypothetical protein SAMN02745150_00085 [Brevinema andersonii]|uniref:Uncharacterized protein n=1 Tax=Brevinema andersonii TaxID=34097 RepID=A0A1I1D4T8_BREAD|nr:hypothetical protein [Brevinema andersonii]SFB67623.1 hypothetical protein SAMN02745150_00085 [Brevinema andersonii]
MNKKYGYFFLYLSVFWLVGLFIFGESGILDSTYKSKEILRLKNIVLQSGMEIEEMTREYQKLKSMKVPDQAFLIQQGRKTQNIIIFKKPNVNIQKQTEISLNSEKQLFLRVGGMALIFLLFGILGLQVITWYLQKKPVSLIPKEGE